MPRYPHIIRVVEAGGSSSAGGAQDPNSSVWTEAVTTLADTVLYEGECDVQEMARRQAISPSGERVFMQRIVAFLEDENAAGSIPVGAIARVTYEDATQKFGEVVGVSRIDGTLDLGVLT